MALLDAFALIAFLTDEPAKEEVEELLRGGGTRISATNLAETYDRSIRTHAIARTDVDLLIDSLIAQRFLTIVPLDDTLARRAGELRSIHYQRRDRDVSHADCAAAATAESLGDSLATPDVHLASLAASIGVEVIGLPDSTGKRP